MENATQSTPGKSSAASKTMWGIIVVIGLLFLNSFTSLLGSGGTKGFATIMLIAIGLLLFRDWYTKRQKANQQHKHNTF